MRTERVLVQVHHRRHRRAIGATISASTFSVPPCPDWLIVDTTRGAKVSGFSTTHAASNATAFVSQYWSRAVRVVPSSLSSSSYAGRPMIASSTDQASDSVAASTSRPVIVLTSAVVTNDGAVLVSPAPTFGWMRTEIAPSDGKVWLAPGQATVNAASYRPGTSVSPAPHGYCTTPVVRAPTNSAEAEATVRSALPSSAIENVTDRAVVRSIGAPVASDSDVMTAGRVSPDFKNRLIVISQPSQMNPSPLRCLSPCWCSLPNLLSERTLVRWSAIRGARGPLG